MNLSGVMLGSPAPKKLAEFYTKILGKPAWDDGGDWVSYQIGDAAITIGPHSEVKGKNSSPGRIMMMFTANNVQEEFKRIRALEAKVIAEPYQPKEGEGMWIATFADPDGNYFQLSTPWE